MLHRAQRSRCKHKLKAYRGFSEECNDLYDELGEDYTRYFHPGNSSMRGQGNWDYIVEDRRGADKLNHFLRWAYETTKDLDPGDRYVHFKKILPDNLIGHHALSHMRMWDTTWVYNIQFGIEDLPYHMRDRGIGDNKRIKKHNNEIFLDVLRALAYDAPKKDRVEFNKFLSKLTYEKIVSHEWVTEYRSYGSYRHVWYRRVPQTETTLYNRLFHGKGDIYAFAQFCDTHPAFYKKVKEYFKLNEKKD